MLEPWDLLMPTMGLYLISYTIAQYLSAKLTVFGLWAVPAGTISFVATMALLDIIVVKYGVEVAKMVIYTGFVAQILIYLANYSTIYLPPAPFWELQEPFSIKTEFGRERFTAFRLE